MNGASKLALASALTIGAIGSAMAELPTGVSTAVTSAGTDGGVLIGLLAAAGAAVFLISKVLKRFGVML
jgi:hypothetical protein